MLEKQIIHSVPFISFKFLYKNGGFGGMLSKNNKKLQAQKMEPKQQRFAIKKFTVGVASVLIGTTFALYGGNSNVSADENAASDASTEVVEDKATTLEGNEVTLDTSKAEEATAATTETSTANTQATPAETVA